jgi:predicted PurR-regulated permease PerM
LVENPAKKKLGEISIVKSVLKQALWLIPAIAILLLLEFNVFYRWWFVETSILPVLRSLILIVGIFLVVREMNSLARSSIARAMSAGIALSLIAALFSGAFSAIYIQYIDQQFPLRLISVNERNLREEGKDDRQIMLSNKATSITYSPMVLFVTAIFWYTTIGVVASFVSFLITARK